MRTTLYDLKEINLNARTLSENMTNKDWQRYFSCMKAMVHPAKSRKMTGVQPTRLYEGEEYCGETSAMRYKQFINGILKTIRSGKSDYAFYIFQLTDLLRYEPSLKAVYMSEYKCFEVSL